MKFIPKTSLPTMITLLMAGITFTSCQLVDIEETTMGEGSAVVKSTGIPTSSHIIYEETFEGSDPFYAYVDKQFAADHSFSASSSESLRGNRSGRFELRSSDPKATDNGKRAEVLFPEIGHKNRWYAFGLLLPSDGYARDSDDDILGQWHQFGVISAPMSLRIQNDRFLLRMKINSTTATEDIDLGPATKDTWHEFTLHAVHSAGKDGVTEIWHNGVKILARNGANLSDGPLPRWKMGIYKPAWAKTDTDTDLRVAYFDNVRMGNEHASYEDMVPSADNAGGWGVDVAEVESLTLINGLTNTAVNALADGGTVNRRLLETERFSIRAEIMQGFGGSVKFDLKGPENNVYIDNYAPFALFGDDSNGKYYHSGGLPLGDYTLTVTPYAEKKADGKAAAPKTIKFRVVDQDILAAAILPAVESFTLIQANTNTEWGTITDGAQLYTNELGTHKLTVRANVSPLFNGRVLFELSGASQRTSYSESAPYVLNNYSNGNYSYGEGLHPGDYTLKATLFPEEGGLEVQGASSTISFRIIDQEIINTSLPTVESLTLIQANTNTEWGKIADGAKFYAKELGTHKLTVRANLSASFDGRVLFELSGAAERTSYSDSAPFVLNNYRNGNYTYGEGLHPGNYTLKVTPFLEEGGKEVQGASSTITFSIL